MKISAPRSRPLWPLYACGLALVVIAGTGLWLHRMAKPETAFWNMMSQSMTTSGVTIQIDENNNGTQAHQVLQYSLGGNNLSRSLTTLTQSGTYVQDETLGTTSADYTRYVTVRTDQKRTDGKPLDFSKVLGVWAKQTGGNAQVLHQSVLGTGLPLGGVAVPIANLSKDARATLLQQIKNNNVYQVDFAKTKKQRVHGRQQYVYDVTLQSVAYATMMKAYAKSVGIHDLDSLDPAKYQGQSPTHMLFTVDVLSRHLLSMSVANTSYKQAYSGYDMPVAVTIPNKTISTSELQQRLTQLQQ